MDPAADSEFAAAWPSVHRAADAIVGLKHGDDESEVLSLLQRLSAESAAAAPADGITLLMLAAAAGASKCCGALVRACAPIAAVDAFGCDALYYAVRHSQAEVVDLLLLEGAPVDSRTGAGGTALIEAATLGDARIASLLCGAGAKGVCTPRPPPTSLRHGASPAPAATRCASRRPVPARRRRSLAPPQMPALPACPGSGRP